RDPVRVRPPREAQPLGLLADDDPRAVVPCDRTLQVARRQARSGKTYKRTKVDRGMGGPTELCSVGGEGASPLPGLSARRRLRRAEDARGAALLLRRLLALAVRRDHDLLALRQIAARDDRVDLLGVERLALEERQGQLVERLAVAAQEAVRLGVSVEDDP